MFKVFIQFIYFKIKTHIRRCIATCMWCSESVAFQNSTATLNFLHWANMEMHQTDSRWIRNEFVPLASKPSPR